MTETNLLKTYQYAKENEMDDLLRATRVAMGDAERPGILEEFSSEEKYIGHWITSGWPEEADKNGSFNATAEQIHSVFLEHEQDFLEENPEYHELENFRILLNKLVENGEIGRHNRKDSSFQEDKFYYTSSVGEAVGKYANIFSLDQLDWVVNNSGMPRFYVCLDIVENKVLELDK